MLVILTPDYPSEKKPNAAAFIHSRVLAYRKQGIEAVVFFVTHAQECFEYTFDGVPVRSGPPEACTEYLASLKGPQIAVHFFDDFIARALDGLKEPHHVCFFVHGAEALYWYERIFPGMLRSPRLLAGFIKGGILGMQRMRVIRNFLRQTIHECTFVTVSEWMKAKAVKNWGCTASADSWNIIPNVISTERFPYCPKDAPLRLRFLTIRSFITGKYANDLTVKIILALRSHPLFEQMHFTIVGDGRLFNTTVAPLRGLPNVEIHKGFVKADEIRRLHSENGVFLCPTRQDAQGVSMCEAMSSGLIPITLQNTAIPEYLPADPLLRCYSVADMAALCAKIAEEPETFSALSESCSRFIGEKCCEAMTTDKEIALFYESGKTENGTDVPR